LYDWRHYVSLLQRKPGALRNGAPFKTMPEPLQHLQARLLRHPGGDRVMAQVHMAITLRGLDDVLEAVEWHCNQEGGALTMCSTYWPGSGSPTLCTACPKPPCPH